ncbi:hypothetical protein CMP1-40 [Clavibacter phage CMP1]|uniref:Uncharacterized protein n=1 Tax=Clavibacter phage CMP1 TaxID=686439 RepID=D0U224_9CAUD|nr:hypothetical protein CMP1-40 [Clavibacter phage CMP1]ACY35936.1 hypothetical protein CMP1-40 [Clavibacter phage CMP1]
MTDQATAPEEAADDGARVVQYGVRVEVAALPASAVKLLKWIGQNSVWKVDWQMSVTDHEDLFYAATDRKGDIKTPAHFREHVFIRGYLVTETLSVARFDAEWEVRIDPVTDKRSAKFVCAKFWDMYTEEQRFEKSMAPFQTWLGILAPTGKTVPAVRKPKQPETMTIQEELEKGEWNG